MENILAFDSELEKPVSVLAFSKILGCSHTAVQNAIRDGKIVKGLFKREDKPDKIIASIASREWRDNVSIKQIEQNPALVENLSKFDGNEPGERGAVSQIAEYEAREKFARARMAELKLAEMEGSLVSLEEINEAQRSIGNEIKTMLEGIGDRNIDNILAGRSRNESLLVLDAAINEVLTRLADLGYKADTPGEI